MSKRNKNKKKDASIDSEAQQYQQEPFTGENLCKNPKCELNEYKHRHSTNDCLKHLFCAQPPLQPIDGTYKDLPEKLPLTTGKDWDEWTRTKAYKEGKFIGYDHLLQTQNECGYFGHEKEIPQGKKLVITEQVMDSWLAAHYGLTIDQVPAGKPDGMNKSIHNYLKHTARETRDFIKNIEKAQKRGQRGVDADPPKKEARVTGVTWQISPGKFDDMYLNKKVQAISYAVKQMKLEEEKKKKSKKREKDDDQQSSEESPKRSQNSDLSSGQKLPIKVLEVEEEHDLSTQSYRNPHRFQMKQKGKYDMKIHEEKRYTTPQEYVRNRINSEYLKFMNYQEIENIANQNLDEYLTRMEVAKSKKAHSSAKRSPVQKDKLQENEKKDMKKNENIKSATSLDIEIDQITSGASKAKKNNITSPELNKRHFNNSIQKRQNISELFKMKEIQQSLVYSKPKPNLDDRKNQTAKVNFNAFDFNSTSIKNPPRTFTKYGDQYGHKAQLSKQRPKTGSVQTSMGRKLVNGNKSRTQAFSSTTRDGNVMTAVTGLSLGGPISQQRHTQNATANEMITNSAFRKSGTNQSFFKPNQKDSRHGKTDSTGIFDGSFTQNMSSQQFGNIPLSAGRARGTQRAATGQLLNSSYQPNNYNSSNNGAKVNQSYKNCSTNISPRVSTNITGQDFLSLLNKGDQKMDKNISKLAKSAQKRLQALRNNTQRGSGVNLKVQNPIRDSVSTNLRIKNEKVTSKILMEQHSLQQILSNQFSLKCTKVDLPLYTQLEILKNSKELMKNLDSSIAPPQSDMMDNSLVDKKRNSMFSDDSIVQFGKNQQFSSAIGSQSKQSQDITQNASQNDINEVTCNNVTFQNIKTNFGLNQDPSYHHVAQRGFRLGNRPPGQNTTTMVSKSRILKIDEVEQEKNDEKTQGKGWVQPIKDQDKNSIMSTKDIMAQHNSWLQEQILIALNDQVAKKGSQSLKEDTRDTEASVPEKTEDVNVEIQIYVLDITVSKVYKNFKDYKFWLQQSQIRKNHPNDWESSLDYLASGLRELPLEIRLIYNYACVNEKIGNYEMALKFFDFAMEIKPRWTDALFGKAVTYFKLGEFKKSKKCVKTAIHNYKNDSFEKLEVMQYFQAMCYKNLCKFQKAQRDYAALSANFRQDEGMKVRSHVVGCILLPLQVNRVEQHEFMENTLTLVSFFQPCEILPTNQRLDNYVIKEGPKQGTLDIQKHGLQIYYQLEKKPFFTRFSRETLMKYLQNAKVEYFKKEDIIFLKGRVAIITHGSVRVISHQEGILKPTTIGKYGEGRILGHGASDGGITINSQTWFTTFDKDTELVFFDMKTFNKLWSLQCFRSSKIILESFLQKNKFWSCLSEQTKYHLIFENTEVRKFRPGQLITRVSKRSAVCQDTYGKFFRDTASNLKDQFENAKAVQNVDQTLKKVNGGASTNEGPSEGVLSSYVSKLTKSKEAPQKEKKGSRNKASMKSSNLGGNSQQNTIDKSATPHQGRTIMSPEAKNQTGIKIPSEQVNQDDEEDQNQSNYNKQEKMKEIRRQLKENNLPFMKKLQKLQYMYKDQTYQEADGIYFVYHGNVDVINPGTRECIYQMGITENFGESKVLRRPGFEYMGDLYAGLHPKGKITDKLIPSIPFHDPSQSLTRSIRLQNSIKIKESDLVENDKQFPRSRMTKINDKLTDDIKDRMQVSNLIPDDKIAQVLDDDDDCVICLFIPYQKFFDVVPTNEIRKIKNCQELQKKKEGVINLFSTKYGLENNELFNY